MWTEAEIEVLSPSGSIYKNGFALSKTDEWEYFGQNETAIWGKLKDRDYQIFARKDRTKYACSCPARQTCKHLIGLLCLYHKTSETFPTPEPPAWTEKLLKVAAPRETEAPDAEKKAKPAEKDENRRNDLLDAIAVLKRKLFDALDYGLESAGALRAPFWDDAARRLTDAKARGLAGIARRIQNLTNEPHSEGKIVAAVGDMYLLTCAYETQDKLPPTLVADVNRLVGVAPQKKEILQNAGDVVTDAWRVLGRRVYPENELTVYHTWLQGKSSKRYALFLDFVHPASAQTPEGLKYEVGGFYQGALTYYPSAYPLRVTEAEILTPQNRPTLYLPFSAANFNAYLTLVAKVYAVLPWLDVFPAAIAQARVSIENENVILYDAQKRLFPLREKYYTENKEACRQLWAENNAIAVLFGEWDGFSFLPLAYIIDDGKLYDLPQPRAQASFFGKRGAF